MTEMRLHGLRHNGRMLGAMLTGNKMSYSAEHVNTTYFNGDIQSELT